MKTVSGGPLLARWAQSIERGALPQRSAVSSPWAPKPEHAKPTIQRIMAAIPQPFSCGVGNLLCDSCNAEWSAGVFGYSGVNMERPFIATVAESRTAKE